jgi:hypothetical protein
MTYREKILKNKFKKEGREKKVTKLYTVDYMQLIT